MTPEKHIPPQPLEQTETKLDIDPSTGGSLMLPDQQTEESLSPFDDFIQKAIALKNQGLDLKELVES